MTKQRYDDIRKWFLGHPHALRLMVVLNAWLARMEYGLYPLLVIYLCVYKDVRVLRVLLFPALVFGLVTVMRQLWNLPRPYEKLQIQPLISRQKKGQSFPSRHVASATIIALAFWYIWPPSGLILATFALLLAIIRVLAGIHFPRDVLTGMLMSLLIGIIGFWVI